MGAKSGEEIGRRKETWLRWRVEMRRTGGWTPPGALNKCSLFPLTHHRAVTTTPTYTGRVTRRQPLLFILFILFIRSGFFNK